MNFFEQWLLGKAFYKRLGNGNVVRFSCTSGGFTFSELGTRSCIERER